jgi:PAS domain S-box-containing protein
LIELGGRQLSRSASALKQAEDEMQQANLLLEEEIAERQMAQEAQQETEARLRIVADYASDWEYWRMPDNSYEYMSPSAAELTGYRAEEFTNNRDLLFKIIHPDDRESFFCHTHHIGGDGRIQPIEFRIVKKDGEVRWIGHTCRQVYAPDGSPWGWRASNQDITARKLIESELEGLNRVLEQRVENSVAELRRKDQILIQQGRLAAMGEMINNIAHQWRQPLNNIALIIQNLQLSFESGTITCEEMDAEIERAMSVIMHMSRTIDDFRNFFREDKEKQRFCVNLTVRRAIEFVSASLESRGIKTDVVEYQDVMVDGYPSEYAQVLLNVISNACETCAERCVDNPHIWIRITAANGRSIVTVRDNCGGISDEILPKIFDPYFTTRSPDKGSGIGLYMSKVIIELNMGGSLTARNVDGGAEFRIEV